MKQIARLTVKQQFTLPQAGGPDKVFPIGETVEVEIPEWDSSFYYIGPVQLQKECFEPLPVKSLTLISGELKDLDNALADVCCWASGFAAAGGDGPPGIPSLRDFLTKFVRPARG